MADCSRHLRLLTFAGLILALLLPSISAADETQIFAHYMPWYSADADAKQWGWHWTMNHFDPNKVDAKGRREIASHHHPIIGPYDSNDPHVLEYHVLLMKLSGIDGVIIDWYGTRDFRDYAMIDRNTRAIIPWLEKAGLKFTFCYEDQTVKHLVEAGKIKAETDIAETVREFNQLADEYFGDDSWLKINNQPLLLVFGPQHFQPKSWATTLRQCKTTPKVFGLPHLAKKFKLDGAFAWPPVTDGKKLSPKQWQSKLNDVYSANKNRELTPVAFPGFHDIYEQAELHDSYGHIDDRDGKTFAESLKLAKATGANLVQIATWNDFGEGTVIEPTAEFGFRYLELLANDNEDSIDADSLKLPLKLFELRRAESDRAEAISEALFNDQIDLARKLLQNR